MAVTVVLQINNKLLLCSSGLTRLLSHDHPDPFCMEGLSEDGRWSFPNNCTKNGHLLIKLHRLIAHPSLVQFCSLVPYPLTALWF